MTTIDEVRDAIVDADAKEKAFLRERGWKFTSDTPGCVWLWRKRFDHRGTVLVGQKEAIQIQEVQDGIEGR